MTGQLCLDGTAASGSSLPVDLVYALQLERVKCRLVTVQLSRKLLQKHASPGSVRAGVSHFRGRRPTKRNCGRIVRPGVSSWKGLCVSKIAALVQGNCMLSRAKQSRRGL